MAQRFGIDRLFRFAHRAELIHLAALGAGRGIFAHVYPGVRRLDNFILRLAAHAARRLADAVRGAGRRLQLNGIAVDVLFAGGLDRDAFTAQFFLAVIAVYDLVVAAILLAGYGDFVFTNRFQRRMADGGIQFAHVLGFDDFMAVRAVDDLAAVVFAIRRQIFALTCGVPLRFGRFYDAIFAAGADLYIYAALGAGRRDVFFVFRIDHIIMTQRFAAFNNRRRMLRIFRAADFADHANLRWLRAGCILRAFNELMFARRRDFLGLGVTAAGALVNHFARFAAGGFALYRAFVQIVAQRFGIDRLFRSAYLAELIHLAALGAGRGIFARVYPGVRRLDDFILRLAAHAARRLADAVRSAGRRLHNAGFIKHMMRFASLDHGMLSAELGFANGAVYNGIVAAVFLAGGCFFIFPYRFAGNMSGCGRGIQIAQIVHSQLRLAHGAGDYFLAAIGAGVGNERGNFSVSGCGNGFHLFIAAHSAFQRFFASFGAGGIDALIFQFGILVSERIARFRSFGIRLLHTAHGAEGTPLFGFGAGCGDGNIVRKAMFAGRGDFNARFDDLLAFRTDDVLQAGLAAIGFPDDYIAQEMLRDDFILAGAAFAGHLSDARLITGLLLDHRDFTVIMHMRFFCKRCCRKHR